MVVICSLYINEWYREITKYGKISLEHYCEKHGYKFYLETENTPFGVYFLAHEGRDIPWYKIRLLLYVFEQNTDADYIVWIDGDTQIINFDIRMEEIIEMYSKDRDLLVPSEAKSQINTGVMIFKNTPYSYDLLRRIWNNHLENDQTSLIDLYTRNVCFEQEHITILPVYLQNVLLTYWYMYYPGQCFIIHIMKNSHDVDKFLFIMDMFCGVKMVEETQEQFKLRQRWLCTEELCRADINHYRSGGKPRNLSARYINRLFRRA